MNNLVFRSAMLAASFAVVGCSPAETTCHRAYACAADRVESASVDECLDQVKAEQLTAQGLGCVQAYDAVGTCFNDSSSCATDGIVRLDYTYGCLDETDALSKCRADANGQ